MNCSSERRQEHCWTYCGVLLALSHLQSVYDSYPCIILLHCMPILALLRMQPLPKYRPECLQQLASASHKVLARQPQLHPTDHCIPISCRLACTYPHRHKPETSPSQAVHLAPHTTATHPSHPAACPSPLRTGSWQPAEPTTPCAQPMLFQPHIGVICSMPPIQPSSPPSLSPAVRMMQAACCRSATCRCWCMGR